MANLTLKNIPENLYDRLKQSAATHHRSLNSEMIVCLESALMPKKRTTTEKIENARAIRKSVKSNRVSCKDITNAKRSGRA